MNTVPAFNWFCNNNTCLTAVCSGPPDFNRFRIG